MPFASNSVTRGQMLYPDGEKNDAEEFIFVLTSFINFLVRVYVEFEYAKLNSVESRNSKSVVL